MEKTETQNFRLKKYESLKLRYACTDYYISLEEFCKINFCSKRAARYLIDHNILPAIDTGRKTWRYKIHINDVITYLRRKEQWGSQIPPGELSSRKKSTRRRKSYSQVIEPGCSYQVSDYFKETYADRPDVLSTTDIGEMTGFHKKSIMRIAMEGHIKYLVVGRTYHIPKVYLLEFVESCRFIDAWSNSPQFIEILEGFIRWQAKRYPKD